MRIPLRYTYATWSVMLATIKSGPSGARSGSQTYWPGFSVSVSGETRTPSVKLSASMTDHATTNNPVTVASNENKNFIAINVQLISPGDASDRLWMSILLNARQPTRTALRDDSLVDQRMEDASQESRARAGP